MEVVSRAWSSLRAEKRDIVIERQNPQLGAQSECIFIYIYTGDVHAPNDN